MVRDMSDIPFEHTSRYAWENYKKTIADTISRLDHSDIIEIGAGRAPLFDKDDLPKNVVSYTINDISQRELDLAPGAWNKACFDVCGDLSSINSRYDFAFSNMLAEHVPDGFRFHSNLFELLKPGGKCFHFIPILYSPPFVINKILPESLSRSVLRLFFKDRHDHGIPKFPARYSMCYGESPKLIARYKSIGYAEVRFRTFYGHGYFAKIPVVRELDSMLSRVAYKHGLTLFGSYSYVALGKPA